MIASNYRKFPEAMALQLVLVFGRCTWHTARPTQRLARAVRAARAVLVKETPQLVRWVKKATPDWFKLAKRAARELANQVCDALLPLVWDLEEAAEAPSQGGWFPNRPHRITSVTFEPKWHSVMTRWIHLGVDDHAWTAQRMNGYRGD